MKKSNSNISISKRELNPSAGRILAYFDERRDVFQRALNASKSYFAIRGVQDLNREITRFRTLFKLIDYAAPSFTSKPNFLIFKELFRETVALRDIDVHQAIALREMRKNDLSEYFNYLKQQEFQCRAAFSDAASKCSPSAIARSRRRIITALAVVSEEYQRKRTVKKIMKCIPRMNRLMGKKKPDNSDLHALHKSAESLRFTLDIWQVCCRCNGSVKDAHKQLSKACRSLQGWHDYLITQDSVDKFLSGEAQNGMSDSNAYMRFQKFLRQQADTHIGAYERDRKPVRNSLKRLVSDLN